jgi:hypothetical protein
MEMLTEARASMIQELKKKALFWDPQFLKPKIFGNVVSNETDRRFIDLPVANPNPKNEVLFTTGTALGWDIAARRRSGTLVILDRSLDVLLAHQALYGIAFCQSSSCREWFEVLKGVEALRSKVSTDERLFFESARQANSQDFGPFENPGLRQPLGKSLDALYNENFYKDLLKKTPGASYRTKFGLDESDENFQHVAGLYKAGRVFYILGDLFKPLWTKSLREFLLKESLFLQDIYLSNIFDFVDDKTARNVDMAGILKELLSMKNPKLDAYIYESSGFDLPRRYFINKIG